jgi:hypothetical protein
LPNFLSANDWKKVVKEHADLKAPGIFQQLEAHAKAEGKKDLLEQVAALNELLDEVKAAKTKNGKNKELVTYLDQMVKEANKSIGVLEAKLAKQAKEEEAEEDEGDEKEKDDSEALDVELLNMIKRLKMAKADAPLRFAVVMKSPKEGSLALSKKKVTPDQIKEAKAGAGGGRVVARGVCFTEEGKSIFETPKEVAGSLSKVVKFYVFRDTGKKIKPIFRVGANLEDEGEEQEGQESEGQESDAGADAAASWKARRAAIQQPYLDALKNQPGKAGDLRAALTYADEKAEAGDFAQAMKSLDRVENLMQASPSSKSGAAAEWEAKCNAVKESLRSLQREILKAKEGNSEKAVIRLEAVVKNLASQPATQQDVDELARWIGADDVISQVDEPNPWGIAINVRGTLMPVLTAMKAELPA